MPRKRTTRLYWRERGGERRAYADLRDLGEGRIALKPKGEEQATTDPDIAQALLAEKLKEIRAQRRDRVLLGVERTAELGAFATHHLKMKARSGRVVKQHLAQQQKYLERACDFLGTGRGVHSVSVRDVERWMHALAERKSRRTDDDGKRLTLSPKTVREHLNALSNLYRRAQAEGVVPPGFNPVQAVMDKPRATPGREAKWFEVPEAALLLESARTYKPPKDKHGQPHMYPIVATALLTGGRKSEVLGLDLEDVSFDRKLITFRPNEHRRLKSSTSHRSVPLWPQLEEILREYVFGGKGPREGRLFVSPRTGGKIHDCRKALDAIAKRAEIGPGELRFHRLRHTYTAARLQTLDNGAPVSEYTVMRELGHSSPALVRRIYGHLGEIRHRTEVVEFRAEQFPDQLGDLLRELVGSETSA